MDTHALPKYISCPHVKLPAPNRLKKKPEFQTIVQKVDEQDALLKLLAGHKFLKVNKWRLIHLATKSKKRRFTTICYKVTILCGFIKPYTPRLLFQIPSNVLKKVSFLKM